MKIGYICVFPWIQDYGVEGAAIHIQEVCNALQKLGHNVFLIAGRKPPISETLKTYDLSIPPLLRFARFRQNVRTTITKFIEIFRIQKISSSNIEKFKRVKDTNPNFTKLSWSPFVFWNDIRERIDLWEYDRYFYKQACKIIETEKPDVLYERFGGYSGIKLAHRYKIPIVLEINGPGQVVKWEWRRKHSPLYSWMIKRWERLHCKGADAVIAVTPFLKKYVKDLGISEEKVFFIPNGVDTNKFYPDNLKSAAIRKKYRVEGKKVVGFVGGIRKFHGLNILIDSIKTVAKEAPDVHFLIVGDGPPREAIEQQARDLGVDSLVIFTGSVPYNDVPAYINAMDITVSPWLKREKFEYLAIKLYEYMAIGKPVVASGDSDMHTVIEDYKNGLIVEPGNSRQLAHAILELLKDKDLRKRLGSAGRRMVEEEYTWEGNAQKIIEIYKNLNKQKRRS